MICKHCGMSIDADSQFCEFCGNSLAPTPDAQAQSNQSSPPTQAPRPRPMDSQPGMRIQFDAITPPQPPTSGYTPPVPTVAPKKQGVNPIVLMLVIVIALLLLCLGAFGAYLLLRQSNANVPTSTPAAQVTTQADDSNAAVATTEEGGSISTMTAVPTDAAIETTQAPTEAPTQPDLSRADYIAYISVVSSHMYHNQVEGVLVQHDYSLYDLNGDGLDELFVSVGANLAEATCTIYTMDTSGASQKIGEFNSGHATLCEQNGTLYINDAHTGSQCISALTYDGDALRMEKIFEENNLTDYEDAGTPIDTYDITDLSPLQDRCMADAASQTTGPRVTANAKTYDYSGQDGAESHLFLDGDFAYVEVVYASEENNFSYLTTDGNVYRDTFGADEFDDYVRLDFNVFALPDYCLYITPYDKSGNAGKTVVCYVPTTASDTIATGAPTYSIDPIVGQINCHGGTVASFASSYVCDGGDREVAHSNLSEGLYVTAKNSCYNYDITWYELWDAYTDAYYGWVDDNYIDFFSDSYSIPPATPEVDAGLTMYGQINCHGSTVASFTTGYVYGGEREIVRKSLGDAWHVTAKDVYYNYGITWYELWDTDDGDYYGWVDSNYIDFY